MNDCKITLLHGPLLNQIKQSIKETNSYLPGIAGLIGAGLRPGTIGPAIGTGAATGTLVRPGAATGAAEGVSVGPAVVLGTVRGPGAGAAIGVMMGPGAAGSGIVSMMDNPAMADGYDKLLSECDYQ